MILIHVCYSFVLLSFQSVVRKQKTKQNKQQKTSPTQIGVYSPPYLMDCFFLFSTPIDIIEAKKS